MRNGGGVGGKEWKNSSKEKKMTFFSLEQGELLADLKFQDLCVLEVQKAL